MNKHRDMNLLLQLTMGMALCIYAASAQGQGLFDRVLEAVEIDTGTGDISIDIDTLTSNTEPEAASDDNPRESNQDDVILSTSELEPEQIAPPERQVQIPVADKNSPDEPPALTPEEQRILDEQDPMQQVINYLVTGDPLQRRREGSLGTAAVEAFIANREECIMGMVIASITGADTVVIHFNNLDTGSIEFENRYLNDQTAQQMAIEPGFRTYLKVTGTPVAVSLGSGGIGTSESVLIADIDRSRARAALDLLYRDFCSGRESNSAF
jgi:hypothetical protein